MKGWYERLRQKEEGAADVSRGFSVYGVSAVFDFLLHRVVPSAQPHRAQRDLLLLGAAKLPRTSLRSGSILHLSLSGTFGGLALAFVTETADGTARIRTPTHSLRSTACVSRRAHDVVARFPRKLAVNSAAGDWPRPRDDFRDRLRRPGHCSLRSPGTPRSCSARLWRRRIPVSAIAAIPPSADPRAVDTILPGKAANDATGSSVAYRRRLTRSPRARLFRRQRGRPCRALVGAGGVAVDGGRRRNRLAAATSGTFSRIYTISLLTPFAAFIPAHRLGLSGINLAGPSRLGSISAGTPVRGSSLRETRVRAFYVGYGDVCSLKDSFSSWWVSTCHAGCAIPPAWFNRLSRAERRRDSAAASWRSAALDFSGHLLPTKTAWTNGWDAGPEYPPVAERARPLWLGRHGGGDSPAIALALPLADGRFTAVSGPQRDSTLSPLSAILLTLVAQGLTLVPPRALHLDGGDEGDRPRRNRASADREGRRRAARRHHQPRIPKLAAAARRLRVQHVHRLHCVHHHRRERDHDDKADAEAHGTVYAPTRSPQNARNW